MGRPGEGSCSARGICALTARAFRVPNERAWAFPPGIRLVDIRVAEARQVAETGARLLMEVWLFAAMPEGLESSKYHRVREDIGSYCRVSRAGLP